MNASKEECHKAQKALNKWPGTGAAKGEVAAFLEAAAKKLPSEQAFQDEEDRRSPSPAA